MSEPFEAITPPPPSRVQDLRRRLREPADGGEPPPMVSVSIGAAAGADPDQGQQLVGDATRALIAAKRAGAGRLVVGGPDVVSLADYRSARRPRTGR